MALEKTNAALAALNDAAARLIAKSQADDAVIASANAAAAQAQSDLADVDETVSAQIMQAADALNAAAPAPVDTGSTDGTTDQPAPDATA